MTNYPFLYKEVHKHLLSWMKAILWQNTWVMKYSAVYAPQLLLIVSPVRNYTCYQQLWNIGERRHWTHWTFNIACNLKPFLPLKNSYIKTRTRKRIAKLDANKIYHRKNNTGLHYLPIILVMLPTFDPIKPPELEKVYIQ